MTPRARGLRRRVLCGIVGALAALAAVGALALHRLGESERARVWVSHTHEVLDAIALVDKADADGTASARTFPSGGAIPTAAALGLAERAARAGVDSVAWLTRDNGAQQRRIPELRRLVNAHFARLHTVGRGAVMRADTLDALVARMRETERDLLARRADAELTATRRARIEVCIGIFGGCAIGLTVLGLLWVDAGRRLRAEHERDALIVGLQDAHEELEAQNEDLLAQSEELVVQAERLTRQSDELQGTRDYLEAVLGHMADGVIAFDEHGAVLLCNPSAQALLGLPHGGAPVTEWGAYTHWYDVEGRTRVADAATPVARARGGSTIRGEEAVVAHQGTRASTRPDARVADGPRRRTISATGRPVRDRTGRYRGAILVLHDITDRKSAERLKNELVSVVSHELRTPLTSIRGSLGLLEGAAFGALPAPVGRLVTVARSNTDRLIRLVNDLLDLEKLQAGRLELRADRVPVEAIVIASADGVRSFAAETGVQVEVDADESEVRTLAVRGDPDRLTQVLTNLLSNAIKFSPAGASVTLTIARPAPDLVRFEVTDMGPGIAERDLPRLFRRFEQLDSSDTRRHGGTGLGLAISKDLVEQHGGTIGVTSSPGTGARFWVELPCDSDAATVEPGSRAADTSLAEAALPMVISA